MTVNQARAIADKGSHPTETLQAALDVLTRNDNWRDDERKAILWRIIDRRLGTKA